MTLDKWNWLWISTSVNWQKLYKNYLSLWNRCFFIYLKLAEVSTTFKKANLEKKNYETVTVLPPVSNVFQNIMNTKNKNEGSSQGSILHSI